MKLSQDMLSNFTDALDTVLHLGKYDFVSIFLCGKIQVLSVSRLQYTTGLRMKNIELVKLDL